MLSRRRCCCEPSGQVCNPCNLPAPHPIRITLTTTPGGTITGVMGYAAGPSPSWSIDCPSFGGQSATLACGADHNIAFQPSYWFSGCDSPPPDPFIDIVLVDHTCDPFHLHYTATNPDAPGFVNDFYLDYP